MAGGAVLTITIDRAAGTVRLAKGRWSMVVPLDDLPRWRAFYATLRDRPGRKTVTGPRARLYEADVRALDAAIRETNETMEGRGDG
jgi:hypothetical protein